MPRLCDWKNRRNRKDNERFERIFSMTTLKFRNDNKVSAKVFILESAEDINKIGLNQNEVDYVKKSYDDDKKKTIVINRYTICTNRDTFV